MRKAGVICRPHHQRIGVDIHPHHGGRRQQCRGQRAIVGGPNTHRVRPVSHHAAQRAMIATRREAPRQHHQNTRRHAFDFFQDVRTEQHRRTITGALFQQTHHVQALTRVEPVERFVEQQQRGLVHEGGRQLGALPHAFAESTDRAVGNRIHLDRGQRAEGRQLGIAQAEQHRTRLHEGARRQHRRQRFTLRHQRDFPKDRRIIEW